MNPRDQLLGYIKAGYPHGVKTLIEENTFDLVKLADDIFQCLTSNVDADKEDLNVIALLRAHGLPLMSKDYGNDREESRDFAVHLKSEFNIAKFDLLTGRMESGFSAGCDNLIYLYTIVMEIEKKEIANKQRPTYMKLATSPSLFSTLAPRIVASEGNDKKVEPPSASPAP